MTVPVEVASTYPSQLIDFIQIVVNREKDRGTVVGDLSVLVSPTKIEVLHRFDRNLRMKARVDDGICHFSLYTKMESGQSHPRMWAKKFVNFAIAYFENAGQPIRAIEAMWNRGEEIFDEWEKLVGGGMDASRAAALTRPGRWFEKLGYTNVQLSGGSTDGGQVRFRFGK